MLTQNRPAALSDRPPGHQQRIWSYVLRLTSYALYISVVHGPNEPLLSCRLLSHFQFQKKNVLRFR